jgi:hypothetical protein
MDRTSKSYTEERKSRLQGLTKRLAKMAEAEPPVVPAGDALLRWHFDFDLAHWEPAAECQRSQIQADVLANPQRWRGIWVRTDAALQVIHEIKARP